MTADVMGKGSLGPETRYALHQVQDAVLDFDVAASEAYFTKLVAEHPIAEVITKRGAKLWVRRQLEPASIQPKIYRAFKSSSAALVGEEPVGQFRLRGPSLGTAQVTNAEVVTPRQGIATAVYDLIEADLEGTGARLVPSGLSSVTNDAFAFWYARKPQLVFYYPHRNTIGPPMTSEDWRLLGMLDKMDLQRERIRTALNSPSLWPKLKVAASLWLNKTLGRE